MSASNPEFIRCQACKRANPVDAASCRNCGAPFGIGDNASRRPYEPLSDKPKNKLKVFHLIIAAIVLVPLLFAIRWAASYGQISVDRLENYEKVRPIRESKEVVPANAWYKSTLKSKIWAEPSIEDVLAKDIERAGGWKALRKVKSIEIEAKRYDQDCDKVMELEITSPEKLAASHTSVSGKFEAPDKFYQLETRVEDGRSHTRATMSNGKLAFSCYLRTNSEWTCESGSDVSANFSFLTGATDYTTSFVSFSHIEIERYRNKVVYSLPAAVKHALPGEDDRRDLLFDVVSGRLVGFRFSHGLVVSFDDFQRVGDVSLPHRICVDGPRGNQTLAITSWRLGTQIDGAIFERPDK